MARLELRRMDRDIAGDISCGVQSIDELIKNAYYSVIYKQAIAYNVFYQSILVGNYMLRFGFIEDEEDEYYVDNHSYPCMELAYIAIDKKFQNNGLGTNVLKLIIKQVKRISDELPIRFFILDAFASWENWYGKAGFREYPKKLDLRYPDTIPMRMDLIDAASIENSQE